MRRSGLLLHISSLPGPHGIGELGPAAFAFADFLAAAGQKVWEVLPLSPTGYGDSPYQSFSAFAGNFLFLSTDDLRNQGLVSAKDLQQETPLPDDQVEFGRVIPYKMALLRRAAEAFFADAAAEERAAFDRFCKANACWLEEYALFMACKEARGGIGWSRWEPEMRRRDSEAMERERNRLAQQIAAHKFWQYEFFRQWDAVRSYCHQRGIALMGDIAIYVAHDSADVWSRQELYRLDRDGMPIVVAGVPPDYYSTTGQLWGNPLYRWELLKQSGYGWWKDRVRHALRLFDLLRIDHFRGFEAYWEIPAIESTAIRGEWIKGPGAELFHTLRDELGELPIVAENLGVITPEVEALRAQFGFPGMSVLQFAFGIEKQARTFRPHNYVRDLVAYTSTHDNDTTVGWWNSGVGDSIRTAEEVRKEHTLAAEYLGIRPGDEIHWVLIRAVMASVADTVMIPVQDLLGLGSEARMNLPGRLHGNWRWRLRPNALTPALAQRLKEMTTIYER